jgi:hypothetical protein
MIRQLLKEFGAKTTEQEFKEILQITTDDIRENRIRFGKRTSLKQMLTIAIMSSKVLMSI